MHGVGRVGFRMSEFIQNSRFVQFSMADFGRNSESFVTNCLWSNLIMKKRLNASISALETLKNHTNPIST